MARKQQFATDLEGKTDLVFIHSTKKYLKYLPNNRPVVPSERSLLIHYTERVSELGDDGQILGTRESKGTKRVRLKTIGSAKDVGKLADSIIRKLGGLVPGDWIGRMTDSLADLQAEVLAEERRARGEVELEAEGGGGGKEEEEEEEEQVGKRVDLQSLGARRAKAAEMAAARVAHRRVDMSEVSGAVEHRPALVLDPATAEMAKRAQEIRALEHEASLHEVDRYLELLYEDDVSRQKEGADRLVALARFSDNLAHLVRNRALMEALSRILKDTHRKANEMTAAVLELFYCISHYSELQPVLTERGVGEMTLKVVDLEQRRHDARMLDLERMERLATIQARGFEEEEAEFRVRDERARLAHNDGTGTYNDLIKERLDDTGSGKEEDDDDDSQDQGGGDASKISTSKKSKKSKKSSSSSSKKSKKSKKSSSSSSSTPKQPSRAKIRALPEGKVDIGKEKRRARMLARRQERTLYYCFHILLNLAVVPDVEKRMVKRNVVEFLVGALSRPNPDLLLLVVTFLRRLSLSGSGRRRMAACGGVEALLRYVPCDHPVLLQAVLRLLANALEDEGARKAAMRVGLGVRCVPLLRQHMLRAAALRVLYQGSRLAEARAQLETTELCAVVTRFVQKIDAVQLPPELAGLVVNLAEEPKTAFVFLRGGTDAVAPLVRRSLEKKDAICVKALRSLARRTMYLQSKLELELASQISRVSRQQSLWDRAFEDAVVAGATEKQARKDLGPRPTTSTSMADVDELYEFRGLWSPLLRDLIRLLGTATSSKSDPSSSALLVETVGLLSFLTPRDLPSGVTWASVLRKGRGVSKLLEQLLDPSLSDSDLVLAAVEFVSALALDRDASDVLADTRVPHLVAGVLHVASRDAEVAMQTALAVYRLLHSPRAATALLYESDHDPVGALCHLMLHPSPVVAAAATDAAEVAMHFDQGPDGRNTLWRRIQTARFRAYNREWCDAADAAHDAAIARGQRWPATAGLHGDGESEYDEESDTEDSIQHEPVQGAVYWGTNRP